MNSNQVFGYARVSSKEQNCARQLEALQNAGVDTDHIFVDKASGKDFEREQYLILKDRLRRGDVLVVKCIDRLGRNYTEIIKEWKVLTKDIEANIRVLDLPLLDTTKSAADLTGTFIADLVLQILSYVAEQERVNIRQRQKEGIALAKERGQRFGRPQISKPVHFDKVYEMWRAKQIPISKAMLLTGLKRSTFARFSREKEQRSQSRQPKNSLFD